MLIEKSRGFTLIELMIVVAIIGILAMFALPQYAAYMKKTKIIEGVNLFNGLKSNVIENFTATGVMQVRNFSELGYSSSEFYSGDPKKLRMSRPLKYIEMANRDNINEFTLVFDESIDTKNNELMMVVYPQYYGNSGVYSGTNAGGQVASFITHCVSYLKTKANVAIQARYLPTPCKPSDQY